MRLTSRSRVKRDFKALHVPARFGVIGLFVSGLGSLLLLMAGRWWSGAVGMSVAAVGTCLVLWSVRGNPPR